MSCEKIKRAVIISKDIDKNVETVEIDKDRLLDPVSTPPPIRVKGNLKNKAYYLDSRYDWKIILDDLGAVCIIPLRKL